MRCGATESEWATFDVIEGLTEDLLPVVSDTTLKISPQSTMKSIGKTPSKLNRAGEVVGISDWTSHITTPAEISRWMTVPAYGVCLQMRRVRALDVDVHDVELNNRIRAIITRFMRMPLRWRADSGKCLFLFRLDGEYSKRTLQVEGGMIEFLAQGQQAVVAGQHVDGQRYQWEGLDQGIPTLTAEQFDLLMCELDLTFGLEGWSSGKIGMDRSKLESIEVPDDSISAYLRDSVWHLGDSDDGRMFVRCPWANSHTSDNGPTQTVYFKSGSNGVAVGRFHCLHAHCAKRTDSDWKDALGWFNDGMESVAEVERVGGVPVPGAVGVNGHAYADVPYPLGIAVTARAHGDLPAVARNKQGRIKPTLDNVVRVLACEDLMGFRVALDDFKDEIVRGNHDDGWQPVKDSDYSLIRLKLHALGFEPVSRDMVRDAVLYLADHNHFDSAIRWIERLEWDGVPRVGGFMHRYMGSANSAYARAMSEYIWTALAGRVINPGCQADHVPVWVSRQGTRKSSVVAAMAPHRQHFVEVNMKEVDDNLARKLRGRVVGEIAELRGLHTKELEEIRAWVTRRYEDFIPKYIEFAHQFARRLIFIGTTNKDEFLADETGNRRWGPIRVGIGDLAAIIRDRDQLWAEGLAMWREKSARLGVDQGIYWEDFDRLAGAEHGEYMMSDTWADDFLDWYETPEFENGKRPSDAEFFQLRDVASGALRINPGSLKRTDELRLAAVLRGLGFERAERRLDGRVRKVWIKSVA